MSQVKFTKQLIASLHYMSDTLLQSYPEQDYDANDITADIIEPLATNLTKNKLQAVLMARQSYENGINKKWKVKFSKNPSVCFTQDLQAIMTKKKVPQRIRITLGLLDTLVGQLQMGRPTGSGYFSATIQPNNTFNLTQHQM